MPGQELPEGFGLKADTLAELADKAGIAEDGLAETIAAFNGYCETGDDLDFKRGKHPWGELMCGDPQQKPNSNLGPLLQAPFRSEEHTSELQSQMRTSYAVFCL